MTIVPGSGLFSRFMAWLQWISSTNFLTRTKFVSGNKELKQFFFFLQQAVRLKEKGIASEIVAVSCGPAKSEVKIKAV